MVELLGGLAHCCSSLLPSLRSLRSARTFRASIVVAVAADCAVVVVAVVLAAVTPVRLAAPPARRARTDRCAAADGEAAAEEEEHRAEDTTRISISTERGTLVTPPALHCSIILLAALTLFLLSRHSFEADTSSTHCSTTCRCPGCLPLPCARLVRLSRCWLLARVGRQIEI